MQLISLNRSAENQEGLLYICNQIIEYGIHLPPPSNGYNRVKLLLDEENIIIILIKLYYNETNVPTYVSYDTKKPWTHQISTLFKTTWVYRTWIFIGMICRMCDCKNKDHMVSPHDDVIQWKHFPRYLPFVRGIHRSQENSPHQGQWRGALMFSLICAWINGWVNDHEAGDLNAIAPIMT